MAGKTTDMKLTIFSDLSAIVKLRCMNIQCKHNLMNAESREAACNMKQIMISADGGCENFERVGK